MRKAAVVLVFGLACCAPGSRPQTNQVYIPRPEDAALCQRSAGPGYTDPQTLAKEYVTHLLEGRIYASTGNWVNDHFACFREYGGWDIATVVSGATLDSVAAHGPVAMAYVHFHRLGFADGIPSFRASVADVARTFQMVRLADGWWLDELLSPHPLASTILARFEWPDSLRLLIQRLARQSPTAPPRD